MATRKIEDSRAGYIPGWPPHEDRVKSVLDTAARLEAEMPGAKHDSGKLRWSLLPMSLLRPVVEVFTDGAKKYTDNGWQNTPNARERYFDALMRHLDDWGSGRHRDSNSGSLTMAHVAANALILLWFELKDGK